MDQHEDHHGSEGRPHAVVVGGGIAGLVAARRLSVRGPRVTLLEAGARLGGQVRTVHVAGRCVDVGAEALHGTPAVLDLLDELGLRDDVVRSRPGTAWIWRDDHLTRLPAGVGPAGPTRIGPVLTSRALSPRGLACAALEPLVGRVDVDEDVGVGAYISRRFGREVTERLVDPVLGSLHAGDVGRLSMRSTVPHLADLAGTHRSILLAQRARRGGAAPAFLTFTAGLATLVDRLLADTDVDVQLGRPVRGLRARGPGYEVDTEGGPPLRADAVVVAVPARAAAGFLGELAPAAADHLLEVRSASVATVVAVYDRRDAERTLLANGTGLLVASSSGRLLKAATFLSTKWAHLALPDRVLVRLSAGRADDDRISSVDDAELVQRLHADLADATGLRHGPLDTHVERWPAALAQLEVGHAARLAAVRHDLAAHPGVVLAGAAYYGLGLAACIRSGEAAASSVGAVPAEPDALTRGGR